MATTNIEVAETPLVLFTLRRADDAVILGHRLSEWCGHGPSPEEDIALANMGLDMLGQARSLFSYAAEIEGAGHDEDDLAYLRDAPQYRNLLLVEQPNGDFGATIARQFFYAAYVDPWWRAMTGSTDPMLAAIAAKAEKETAYHLRHASEWMIRLGDGTAESHRRAQAAVDQLFPYVSEMFEGADEAGLVAQGIAADPAAVRSVFCPPTQDIAADPAALRPVFDATVAAVLDQATLQAPAGQWAQRGGRLGRHSEHLGFLLAEMQHLQRAHPGAAW